MDLCSCENTQRRTSLSKLVLRPQLLQVKATVSKEYCCRTFAEKDVGSGSKTRLQNQLSTPFEAHAVWE